MNTFFQLANKNDQDVVDFAQGMRLIELLSDPSDITNDFYSAFRKQKTYKVFQIKLFVHLLARHEPFWKPDSNYSFVWNPDLSFTQMRIGMNIAEDQEALAHVLSADAAVLYNYDGFFHEILASGVAFSEVSWMFRCSSSPHRLSRMLQIYITNNTIPLKLFADKANAEKFYQYCSVGNREEYLQTLLKNPVYSIPAYYVKNSNSSPQYVQVRPTLSDLDVVDRVYLLLHELACRFPAVNFDRLLNEKTLDMPAVIKMLMDKSCPSLEKILNHRNYPAEILAEWYDWTCSGLDNFESVYSELLFAAANDLYRPITSTDLSAKLHALKEIAITCKKRFWPFPIGICHCTSVQDMKNYLNLYYETKLHASSFTESEEVQCLFNHHNFSHSTEFADAGILLSFDAALPLREQNVIRRAIEKNPKLTSQLLTGKTYQVNLYPFAQYKKGVTCCFALPPEMCGGLTIRITYTKGDDVIKVYV